MKIVLNNLEEFDKSGIYCIKNIINDKLYIGSTINKFKSRFKQHLLKLKNNKHHNVYLQRAINKYGIENFEFKILEISFDKIILRELEKKYIDELNSVKHGYNHSNNTISPPNTKEIRNKISTTLKKLHSENEEYQLMFKNAMILRRGKPSWNKGLKCENISNTRKKMFNDIEVYDLEMNFFRKFDNAIEIEKFSRSEYNDLPIPKKISYYPANKIKSYDNICWKPITNKIIAQQNIHRAIRNNKPYKGLFFKKVKTINT